MQKFLFVLCSTFLFSFALPAQADDLLQRLTQPTGSMERQKAIEEMDALGASSKNALVPQLTGKFKDRSPAVRENAAHALGALDQAALPAVEDLKQLQKDPSEDVRSAASASLARLGVGNWSYVEQLGSRLTTQLQAPPSLANMPAAQTQAKLARYEAADELGFIAEGPKHVDLSPAIPALAQAVAHDPDADVRNRAAWALGTLGRPAHAALPALKAATRDPAVKDVASWAIDQIHQ